jgi:hypothetical protein
MRRTALAALLVSLGLLGLVPPSAHADERLPGEVATLDDDARAKAKAQIDALYAALKEEDAAKRKDGVHKARRALLAMGPEIWPVLENASRLVPPEASKPHYSYLRALLVKKEEPEFEYLRQRLRRQLLIGNVEGIRAEVLGFRIGRPDPKKAGAKIPPAAKPTMKGPTYVFRSADGSLVLAYGGDGNDKNADAPDVTLDEATAGFVVALGGSPKPLKRHSGGGGHVVVAAPMGFAFAWASDGAPGVRPGGEGGDGGEAQATGGAGEFAHSGAGGAGAPG